MEPNVTLLKTSDHLGGEKVMYRNYMLEIKMKHWQKKSSKTEKIWQTKCGREE